ncbi:phosphatidylethanolamine N-methyltransferase [Linderina pennispora]|nr:phosphatidylethanolamine N-methyltransferase [Linderina pennispora]
MAIKQRLGKKKAAAGRVSSSDEAASSAMPPSDEKALTGRTPDGTAFAVPKTSDMLQSLFNPFTPKTTFDLFTLLILSTHLLVFVAFPLAAKRRILVAAFAFWRLCYNGGLGWILNWQSNRHGLVALFKRNGWLDASRGGSVYVWLKAELEAKMGADYSFENVPLEFNVWLLYRQLVDLILLNDFMAYFFLCACYIGSANDSETWQTVLRVVGGVILLAFNLWVKVDAHRVVKDYAWYWGDFFFLVEQSLTFDGVFEMAPHPMYSIGYAGYYGGSLITGSYTIFYASLAAHMLQFLFLSFVENPHIEKTYERAPLAIQVLQKSRSRKVSLDSEGSPVTTALTVDAQRSIRERPASLWHPELIFFKNLDLFRASDILTVLLLAYSVGVPLLFLYLTGYTSTLLVYSSLQCLWWILFRTLVLGVLLRKQSADQFITRWFIKHGGNSEEAFSSWRAVYNSATIMIYGSFALVAVAGYHWGDADYSDLVLFHTLGLLLIAFHVWSSRSVYDTLGDFGWFYGDFFARSPAVVSLAPADIKLYYTGIYRYLNNPEKVIGQAAFYGLALISRSWTVFALALFFQCGTFLFGAYVETPHMEKVYGTQIHRDSGIVRTVKKAVNKGIGQPVFADDKPVPAASGSDDTGSGSIAELLTMRPVKEILQDTRGLLSTTTARLAERALPSELSKLDHLDSYSIKLQPGAAGKASKASRNEYYLGEPIRIAWTAPRSHSRRDWVGIYPVTANFSSQITTASSRGCYVYIHPDENLLAEKVPGDSVFTGHVRSTIRPAKRNAPTVEVLQGEAVFSSAALPFRVGTYEMRLHHGGTHAVIAQSKPFEITVCESSEITSVFEPQAPPATNGDVAPLAENIDELSLALMTIVNKTLAVTDSRPEPKDGDVVVRTEIVEPLVSVLDPFAVDRVLDERQAKRLGYAIKEYFGVEFSPDVLIHAAKHEATVQDVARRIVEARRALSEYSSLNFKV